MNRHLLIGQFYYDNNDIMGNIIAGGLSRNQHEGVQNFAGLTFGAYQIAKGKADRVDYFGGATFVTDESNGGRTDWGVSLGNVINMSIRESVDEARFSDYVIKTPIYMHEYGHTFDSRYYGGFYLLGVGLPSLISVSKQKPVAGEPPGVSTHDFRWYEMSANQHAARYFSLYYGIDWNSRFGPTPKTTIETYYPTRRR